MLKGINRFTKASCLSDKEKNRQLLIASRNGDLESFSKLYSRFYKPILKYVRKSIKNRNIAEEITQDIFCKIYQFKDSYDPSYEVNSWLWTIARNTIYDHLRQLNPSSTSPIAPREVTLDPFPELFSTETAESLMIKEIERRKLHDLIASLSSKQKEAIFLRLVKKFSYHEISKTMNISLSAVKSLISRGKSALIKVYYTDISPQQAEDQEKITART